MSKQITAGIANDQDYTALDFPGVHAENKEAAQPFQTLGIMTANTDLFVGQHSVYVLAVQWQDVDLSTLADQTNFFVSSTSVSKTIEPMAGEFTIGDNYISTLGDIDTRSLLTAPTDHRRDVLIVSEDDYPQVTNTLHAMAQIQNLLRNDATFSQIALNDHLYDISSILTTLPDDKMKQYVSRFRFSSGLKSLRQVAYSILEDVNPEKTYNLLSSEQQIETFLDFSKQSNQNVQEIVPDAMIEKIKESTPYRWITEQLAKHGFGLSKTQQMNVFQTVGLFGQPNQGNIIHNLSDMGAGKTLMTVESIALLDLLILSQTTRGRQELPSKNIIAPALSIESSWIDTFKLFYDVEKTDENTYTLTINYYGRKVKSYLYTAPFIAKTNSVSVKATLPVNNHDYLIIDEIHQLLERTMTASRFFDEQVDIAKNYHSFILSGTMSNLTVNQWYNYVKLMKIELPVLDMAVNQMGTEINRRQNALTNDLKDSVEKSVLEQNREMLPLDMPSLPAVDMGKKDTLYRTRYGTKILSSYESDNHDLANILDRSKGKITVDANFDNEPNFELFYQLVGNSAITASSDQISHELFDNDHLTQETELVNLATELSASDIQLLKEIYTISKDWRAYKSAKIGQDIQDAILNLNDGLSNKSILDVIEMHAKNNNRFLEYLTEQSLDLLENLKKSSLIKTPSLDDSQKFQNLKAMIKPENTTLIVVNDKNGAKKLAQALDITPLTHEEMTKDVNFQKALDNAFAKQNVVVVPQSMVKSSLDLVQANVLIQYQLSTAIADIIQTQNRINRIGQKRSTVAYYMATDSLQENIIQLFLETYRNIKVAHLGITELFADLSKGVNVVDNLLDQAMDKLTT